MKNTTLSGLYFRFDHNIQEPIEYGLINLFKNQSNLSLNEICFLMTEYVFVQNLPEKMTFDVNHTPYSGTVGMVLNILIKHELIIKHEWNFIFWSKISFSAVEDIEEKYLALVEDQVHSKIKSLDFFNDLTSEARKDRQIKSLKKLNEAGLYESLNWKKPSLGIK